MHPLMLQLRAVGRRAQRLLLCRAAALWACVIMGALLAAGCADFWFRYAEVEMRWLASAVVTAVVIWAGIRLVWPAIRFHRSEHTVAQWIERRFPEFQDRLASAVTFVNHPTEDPRYGSMTLRQSVVDEASTVAATKDLQACLDARPAQRAAWILLATSTVVLTVCAADVQSATTAMRRIVMPWSQVTWPRRTWLLFTKRPQRLAVGQDFEVEVVDRRGWLPSEVNIEYWFDGDPESDIRVHRMEYAGGKMTHRLEQVTQSFRYRAVGGDDQDMEWTSLVAVDAPRIASLHIELEPPAYSGIRRFTSPDRIHGLAGTVLQITGTTSVPVRAVELHLESDAKTKKYPATPAANGLGFEFPATSAEPFLLQQSGRYAWLLVDQQGVSNPLEFNRSIEVLSDLPPTIALDSPQPDSSITATGVIHLRAIVKDDLAVKNVLVETATKTIPLFERSVPPAIDSTRWPPPTEQRTVEQFIELRELGPPQPGQSVTLRLSASDFRPQLSQPVEISLTIISPEEFKTRLDDRQAALLERVREALRLQRDLRTQLQTLRDNTANSTDQSIANVEALAALEIGQTRVREFVGGDQGALGLVQRLTSDVESNRFTDPELRQHLADTETDLKSLAADVLPPIESQLAELSKRTRTQSAQRGPTNASTVENQPTDSLYSTTTTGQDRAVEGLERILDRLSEWADYRLLARDVAQMIEEQQKLLNETQALSTAAREFSELPPAAQSQLRHLDNRQRDLAARLDRLHQRLERMRRQIGDQDENTAATMDAALDLLRSQSVATQMRESAQHLGRNRIGAAERAEQRVLQSLTGLLQILSHRAEQDPARVLEELRAIGGQLNQLREEQAAVEQQAHTAKQQQGAERKDTLEKMAARQGQLTAGVAKLERALKRLPGNDIPQLLQQAMRHMEAAEEAAQQDDAEAAQRSAEQATQKLTAATKQMARDQQAAQQAQAAEEMRWLAEALKEFESAQRTLRDQTSELAKQIAGNSEFTAEQKRLAESFEQQQLAMSQEVVAARDRIGRESVFSFALDRVALLMQQAGQRIGQRAIDAETIELQSQAMARLQRLLEAITLSPSDPTDLTQAAEDQPSTPGDDAQGKSSIAELRLLRSWQQEINERTEVLVKAQAEAKSLTPQQISELDQLVDEQEKLAEFVEQLERP